MQWIIAGLGNPGSEYDGTRHNVGRDFLIALAKKEGVKEWKEDKKLHGQSAKAELFGKKALMVLPDTYMNNSGKAFLSIVTSKKQAEQLVVVQDELDLPLGTVKIAFGASAGGHRGVDSIQKALKTKDFVRIRVGISPATASGKTKKPDQEKVVDFVLGKFKPSEEDKLKKARKVVFEAIELMLSEGREAATMKVHTR
ncbi:MAG TPA: aminoacyl-tRNA hydrolase [Candidatus Paceibacterota bacterium]|nr:aminoacyl-tRNA hydrolase [Candidatus Paceibacterota bacterium]